MSQFDPNKLSVEFGKGVTKTEPIIPRRYTLTHSDITAELFLNIDSQYAYHKINAMRDEVLGEWVNKKGTYNFNVYLYVNGKEFKTLARIRNSVFRRELPLALEAIRYGDSKFFNAHPNLDNVPIIVYFKSTIPKYNKVENWGTFADYKTKTQKKFTVENPPTHEKYLIDTKIADVTGDGIPDKVFLYGYKPIEYTGLFVENITIEIEDGYTKSISTITPHYNSGYSPSLFLGDFTKDHTADIKLNIDTGGSGGYGYFYIYTYKNSGFVEIFNFDKYNHEYKFRVDYINNYKIHVANVALDKLFILDISYKPTKYLSQHYNDNGSLIKPEQGEVLALSTLPPFLFDETKNSFDLLAFQRIIGTFNADTLGYIQNLLTWDGEKFVSSMMFASIFGTNLISPY